MAIIKSKVENRLKKKKVSKKSKKSWRKHSDIKDVDDFLEISRFEDRTGGPASEKKDSALFFIDNCEVQLTRIDKAIDNKSFLKCHSSLINNELTIPRATRSTSEKKIKRIDEKLNAKIIKSINKDIKEKPSNKIYDIWGTPENIFEDLHNAKVTKKMPIKVPRHHSVKPSGLPAVSLPHPGMSYNPLLEDHQDLLSVATEVEVKKDRLDLKIFQATDAKFPTADQAPDQLSWLKEMSEGLPDIDISLFHKKLKDKKVELIGARDNDSKKTTQTGTVENICGEMDENEEGEGGQPVRVKPVWRGNKKTEKQRRAQRAEKEKKLLKKREKIERIKKDENTRIKSMKKELREKEMRIAARKVWRQLDREKKQQNETKKLGRGKFVEPNMPLKLTEELEGPLRLLKPEGHILEDVLRSFQRRNMLTARSHLKPQKRRQPKVFEKKRHKEITA